MNKQHTRRDFLRVSVVMALGGALAACAPKVVKETVEKVVKETVEVEKVVKETIMVEGTPQVVEKVVTKEVEKVVTTVVEKQMLNAAPHDLPYEIKKVNDGKEVTITLWVVSWPELWRATYGTWGAEYSRYNPNVKVELVDVAEAAYEAKLQTAIPAGEGPTIIKIPHASVHDQYEYAQPFPTDLFPPEYFKRECPMLWGCGESVDHESDELYHWSPGYMNQSIYYNKDILAEEGISEDELQPPMSWEKLLELGKRCTRDLKGRHIDDSGFDPDAVERVGLGLNLREYYLWQIHESQAGQFVCVAETGQEVVNARAQYDFLIWLKEAYDSYAALRDFPMADISMGNGEAAFSVLMGHFATKILESYPDLNYGTVPVPVIGANPKPPMALPAYLETSYGVIKGRPQEEQDAGWDFLSFSYGNGEKLMDYCQRLSLFSMRTDLQNDPRTAAMPGLASCRYFGDRSWLLTGGFPTPDVNSRKAVIQEVIQEDKDICETLAYYQKLCDEAAAAYTATPGLWKWKAERTEYKYASEMHEPEMLTDKCPPE